MNNLIKEIKITIKSLLTKKGRSFLTILGIVIGVSGVIIIISLGNGAQSLVLGQISKLGSNIVAVLPGKSNEKGPPSAVYGVQIKTLVLNDVNSIRDKRNVPDATEVAPVVRGNTTVIYGGENVDTSFTATEGSFAPIHDLSMSEGEFFTDEEARSGASVAVLGYTVAKSLFPNGGAIGKVIKVKVPNNNPISVNEESPSIPLRVIGVQKKMGNVAFLDMDDQIYFPFLIGQRQMLGIDYVQMIHIKIDNSSNIKSSIDDIKRVLRSNHRITNPENDDFSVRDLADAINLLKSITGTLSMFLSLMAGLSLVVGGIGIMNIMLVTVSERTKEIGLRKAIGATNKDIRNQFLRESIILTVAGGVFGILFGVLISYLIYVGVSFAGYDWSFVVSPISIILATLVSVLTGVIFGLYPALKAAKLDPIVALRYE